MSSPLLLLFYLRLKLCFYFPLNDIFIVKTKILNVTPPIHETRNTGTGKGMWGNSKKCLRSFRKIFNKITGIAWKKIQRNVRKYKSVYIYFFNVFKVRTIPGIYNQKTIKMSQSIYIFFKFLHVEQVLGKFPLWFNDNLNFSRDWHYFKFAGRLFHKTHPSEF